MFVKITPETLTTGERTGQGIFDELMRSVRSHLDLELSEQRLTGTTYTEVYLGALQGVLENAVQYALAYEVANQNAALLEMQAESQRLNNCLIRLQKEMLRVEIEQAKFTLEKLMPQQYEQGALNIELTAQQVRLTSAQVEKVAAEINATIKQGELIDEQIRGAQDQHTNPTGGLNLAQYEKLKAETVNTEQRTKTEEAQIRTAVDGITVSGLVGQEVKLKEEQTASLRRNSELQAAKLFSDVFSVLTAAEAEGLEAPSFGFGSTNSNKVVEKVLTGINVPV